MAARTQTRRNGTDPLKQAKKALDKAEKNVDDLTRKLDTDTRARIAELAEERRRIGAAREALGLDSGEATAPPARRGRRRTATPKPSEVQA